MFWGDMSNVFYMSDYITELLVSYNTGLKVGDVFQHEMQDGMWKVLAVKRTPGGMKLKLRKSWG